jgi:hypothetical protein
MPEAGWPASVAGMMSAVDLRTPAALKAFARAISMGMSFASVQAPESDQMARGIHHRTILRHAHCRRLRGRDHGRRLGSVILLHVIIVQPLTEPLVRPETISLPRRANAIRIGTMASVAEAVSGPHSRPKKPMKL